MNTTPSQLKHQIVFVSHGAPTLVIEDDAPTNHFLKALGKDIGKPSAIIALSAHWEARVVEVNTASKPEQIYDFGGFPDRLYQQIYHPPGSPELAQKILAALENEGLPCAPNSHHGLDHGAWCPLKLMYPDEDIPVVQVSLIRGLDPALHQRLGKALISLLKTEPNVLLLASGGVTHNLGEAFASMGKDSSSVATWSLDFTNWVSDVVMNQEGEERKNAMAAFETHRYARKAHPRTEHFLPLVALTGSTVTGKATRLHNEFQWDLSLAAYAFPLN